MVAVDNDAVGLHSWIEVVSLTLDFLRPASALPLSDPRLSLSLMLSSRWFWEKAKARKAVEAKSSLPLPKAS